MKACEMTVGQEGLGVLGVDGKQLSLAGVMGSCRVIIEDEARALSREGY